MRRALVTALLVTGLLAAPIVALAGNFGRPNLGVIGIPGPGIVAPGSYGSPLIPVPNTAAARQWSPRHAPGVTPHGHGHHRAHPRQGVFVPSTVVVVVPQAAPQPQWVEAGWWWDGWQWMWVPGYWTWRNNRYEWMAGHWEMPARPGAVWVPPRWQPEGSSWRFYEGYWD